MNFSFDKLRSIGVQKLGLGILCVILALVLIVMIFATAFIHDMIGNVSANGGDHIDGTLSSSELDDIRGQETLPPDYTGATVDPSDVTIPTVPNQVIDNPDVINIMLVGQDRRPGQGRQRSDSMILCSFNTKTHSLSMISFLRDTYVSIPGFWPDKMNAAYAYGGMKTLTATLAANFGVHLDGCVEVDFGGFTNIIDKLGGVDITLTQKEADWLNNEQGYSLTAGLNRLNGEQALNYSRIRKLDADAKRAERQRKVINSIINSYKNQNPVAMLTLTREILASGWISTNMSGDEIIDYVTDLFPLLSDSKISSHQIPINGTWDDVKALGNIVDLKVITDMQANRDLLQQLLG